MGRKGTVYLLTGAELGSAAAIALYERGLAHGQRSEEYDRKNYEYYYDVQKHYEPYERRGKRCFERAAACFARAAALGNGPAMMNYAMYLFAFRGKAEESLAWFLKASEAGVSTADYQLAAFYANGVGGVTADAERARTYFARYCDGCDAFWRQSLAEWGVDESLRVLGKTFLYLWFCGEDLPLLHDTPRALPSRWKYGKKAP